MARKNGSPKANNTFPESRFVNLSLSVDEQKHCSTLLENEKLEWNQVFDAVCESFKFSLKLDAANHTFVASFTEAAKGNREYSVILTGRGSTPSDAVASLLYKHLVMSEKLWADQDVPEQDSSRFR